VNPPQHLLELYKPRLVILAQDPKRHRPWSRWYEIVKTPRGDYHPCSAEFFLSFVFKRDRPRPWLQNLLHGGPPPQSTGLEVLRGLVLSVDRDATLPWELDVAGVRSQDGVQAWRAYAEMLAESGPFQPTMYGRAVQYAGRTVLTYWFLSAYNDAPNKHEGDFEMIAIELDSDHQPVQAGYSSHQSGLRRRWTDVEKDQGRPLVYVARGSHASYFDHKRNGHRTNSIPPRKGLDPRIEYLMAKFAIFFQDLVVVLRLLDRTPTHPDRPGDQPLDRGEFLDPELVVLPELTELDAQPQFWWMRLRCPWGSRHVRFFGDIAPDPPWEHGAKWTDPSSWINGLADDVARGGPPTAGDAAV
jgi:hypothetical protein